jgi:hypothetical protein
MDTEITVEISGRTCGKNVHATKAQNNSDQSGSIMDRAAERQPDMKITFLSSEEA